MSAVPASDAATLSEGGRSVFPAERQIESLGQGHLTSGLPPPSKSNFRSSRCSSPASIPFEAFLNSSILHLQRTHADPVKSHSQLSKPGGHVDRKLRFSPWEGSRRISDDWPTTCARAGDQASMPICGSHDRMCPGSSDQASALQHGWLAW